MAVRRRIEAAGGDPGRVRIVAVTKGFPVEAVIFASANGIVDVGENYAQELLSKATGLGEAPGLRARCAMLEAGLSAGAPPRWHFLGNVQRNKVRALAPAVTCWQGVSRLVEAEQIALRRPGAQVLVEVDTTGAPGRHGCPARDVGTLVEQARGLDVEILGLMTVAPKGAGQARRCFAAVRGLADLLGLPERSMGMSDDLEEAVAEGSTMIRVGRALFGPDRRSTVHPRR